MVTICEICRGKIVMGEEFVLQGTYPPESQIFSKTHFKNRTAPESFGKIYHKKCFEEQKAQKHKE
jgi:hypothetical protein